MNTLTSIHKVLKVKCREGVWLNRSRIAKNNFKVYRILYSTLFSSILLAEKKMKGADKGEH